MRIGLLGVQCDTANLGLAALAYCAVDIAHRSAAGDAEFVLFSINAPGEISQMQHQLGLTDTNIRAVPFRHKQPRAMLNSLREIRSCDVVIDFTGGDSFSDIYGLRRLARKLFHKQLVLSARRPLVLAPQTYGPLRHRLGRPWFTHVVNRASLVLTRDELSADFLRSLTHRQQIHVSTDVAVTLPFHRVVSPASPGGATRVGFNVSGLLWAGGYTGDNQFGLSADYRDYCRQVVRSLIAEGNEVHLVPHVLSRDWESDREDDVEASRQLQAEEAGCHLAPAFTNPVEAKSWISGLDVFIGSRMHATIAAFTAGVPTVPVAYSRKFAGFFGNLGYTVLVDLTTTSTSDAVENTLALVAGRNALKPEAAEANALAEERIDVFREQLTNLLKRYSTLIP